LVLLSNRQQDDQGEDVRSDLRIIIDGDELPISGQSVPRDLLPELVVAFTTGDEEEWSRTTISYADDLMDPARASDLSMIEQALRELPGKSPLGQFDSSNITSEASRCMLIRAMDLPLVTLAGLLENMRHIEHSPLKDVLQQAGIGEMRGFSLRFRLNRGIVSELEYEHVARLRTYATRALRLGSDRLLVFDLSSSNGTVGGVLSEFSSGLGLVQTLSRMQAMLDRTENVLQEVNVFIERVGGDDQGSDDEEIPLHLLSWLSDGEQSFLGRMSLFTLMREKETLILLDEPEVHFNDYWKRHIVHLLDSALFNQFSHLLVTTHSSITLTDVSREDIVLLDRQGVYTSNTYNPATRTLAADPGDVMVHVFGAPYPTGALAVSRISKLLEDLQERPSPDRVAMLRALLDQVAPGYWSYRIRQALTEADNE